MIRLYVPKWSDGWSYFSDGRDLIFIFVAGIVIALMIIWWRQQTRYWFRIAITTFLAALVLCISSIYLFEVPVYYVGCPDGCVGWRGYPLPVVLTDLRHTNYLMPLDFGLNLLMLWLLWLGASFFWRLLATAIQWEQSRKRTRLFLVLFLFISPWALMPRVLQPPQPTLDNEALRLTNNASRLAEFTYSVTGLWVQRLAVEDIRYMTTDGRSPVPSGGEEGIEGMESQVCLRGYTYFFIPWRRYRVHLGPNGITALRLAEVPLNGSCWKS